LNLSIDRIHTLKVLRALESAALISDLALKLEHQFPTAVNAPTIQTGNGTDAPPDGAAQKLAGAAIARHEDGAHVASDEAFERRGSRRAKFKKACLDHGTTSETGFIERVDSPGKNSPRPL
jgi:hypothetical protein